MAEEGALFDVKVIDLTQNVAGPYCTKLFADYGAEVIKIEKPGQGDIGRRLGPFPDDVPHPEKSGMFLHLNTNKKSLTLDITTETGKRILKNLVKDADILVESFDPGVMESFGLSYEELEKINPNLVMTSITNFGQTGPYRDYKSSDMVTYAMGGLLHITGVEDANPVKIGNYAALCLGGGTAAATTMCTFFGAHYQDIGQHLDISLMEAIVGSMDRGGPNLVSAAYSGDLLMFRAGAFRTSAIPTGNTITNDGYVWINSNPGMFPKLCRLIGRPDLIEHAQRLFDPTFFDEMDAALLSYTVGHSKTEIMEEGGGDIAITALNTVADVVTNKHFTEREFFQVIDHPVAGKLKYPGPLFRMTETPWRKGRAPLLGEHNQEVLSNLGYSKDDIVKLRETGVI